MSGLLFNFFLDDLIQECCSSGFGETFNEIIMCILGFCDDISLLSCKPNDLQELLNICEKYTNDWALEFNIPKCFLVRRNN